MNLKIFLPSFGFLTLAGAAIFAQNYVGAKNSSPEWYANMTIVYTVFVAFAMHWFCKAIQPILKDGGLINGN